MENPLLLSFLFVALIASKPLLGAGHSEPVLDINGEKVLTGTPYYIVSAIFGAGGGGVSVFPTRDRCPRNVIQLPSDLDKGLPLLFSPATKNGDGIVYESSDLNIRFYSQDSVCLQIVWRVNNYDPSTGQWFITRSGVAGKPGAATLQNWFKFERVANTNFYKIVHCPKVCETCATLCSDVGVDFLGGQRRLVLKADPGNFLINFIKADEYFLHADKNVIRMVN